MSVRRRRVTVSEKWQRLSKRQQRPHTGRTPSHFWRLIVNMGRSVTRRRYRQAFLPADHACVPKRQRGQLVAPTHWAVDGGKKTDQRIWIACRHNVALPESISVGTVGPRSRKPSCRAGNTQSPSNLQCEGGLPSVARSSQRPDPQTIVGTGEHELTRI
jgi:hypothetical protein